MARTPPADLKLRVRQYAGRDYQFCVESRGWYLFIDGVLRNDSSGISAEVIFDSREEAEYAFDTYNKKKRGSSMDMNSLKTGMVVVTANGNEYMVIKDDKCDRVSRSNGFLRFDNYNVDMTMKERFDSEYDIVGVYVNSGMTLAICKGKKLWTRDQSKNMTIAEIEAKLGYSVKVVK